MGRYEVDDIHVVFGSPDKGHRLHRIAPFALSPDASRTLCGLVVVRGVDRVASYDEFDPSTPPRLCKDCEEIKGLCDLMESAMRELEEHEEEMTELRRQADSLRSKANDRRRSLLRKRPGSGARRPLEDPE